MSLKPLMKEWRIWVLGIAILASLVMLGPHYEQNDDGNVVIATGLNQGLDLKGGTRLLLDVQTNNTSQGEVDRVKNILETRVSAFGLTETDIRTVKLGEEYKIQLEVANTNRTQIEKLVSQEGSFEARMPIPVTGSKEFELAENTYTFTRINNSVEVNGSIYSPGDRFTLDGTEFVYLNNTDRTANLEAVMYSGQDVQQVLRSDALVRNTGSGYSFQFPVIISTESAENVRTVASNYDTILLQGQPYLGLDNGEPAKLGLYVDDQKTSSLNIAASFKQNVVTQPSISGGEPTAQEARDEMHRLQSILESGRLPYPVQVESASTISAALGSEFLTAAFISIVLSLVAVGGLVFVRYGSPKIAIPIVITGSSEVFILLGAWFATVATLDLASIAGIIAAVGTGVDDQIIITDESGREKVRSWKKRMKRAFFVIFTSAASTCGAMLPLVSPELSTLAIGAAGLGLMGYTFTGRKNPHYIAIGAFAVLVSALSWSLSPSAFALQAVQGFAVTTILGIMVGITITRPAYATILEYIQD